MQYLYYIEVARGIEISCVKFNWPRCLRTFSLVLCFVLLLTENRNPSLMTILDSTSGHYFSGGERTSVESSWTILFDTCLWKSRTKYEQANAYMLYSNPSAIAPSVGRIHHKRFLGAENKSSIRRVSRHLPERSGMEMVCHESGALYWLPPLVE